MKDETEFFERRIVTGMIVSTDYLKRIHRFWNPALMESPELSTVAKWCMDYFNKYRKAPDTDIETIYVENLKNETIFKAEAEYIEMLLNSLSDEYGRGTQFNSAYLFDRSILYFKAQELEQHNQEIQALIDAGQVEEAEKLAQSYTPTIFTDEDTGLDLSSEEALKRVEIAFNETSQRVVSYPGALGEMWNEHLVRGGFFTVLAPEKRGKTYFLLDIALRAIRSRANVAFFEAGDMTEAQILRRICVYLAQRSDRERYCQSHFRPVGDCIFNQIDSCERADRNCDHGIFENMDLKQFHAEYTQHVNLEKLSVKYEEYPDYEPCDSHSCQKRQGTVWIKKIEKKTPLTSRQAKKRLRNFFRRYKRRFKLITYPPDFLTVAEIRARLNDWERFDGFVPDVIAVDYADLLSADDGAAREFRHRQDHVWKNLRALSQERHALVISATQADAESYKRDRLSISNFSEDKRKLAHVTAQYGLNQDPSGREKGLGILRVNEIVVREGAFSSENEVYVLQDLAAGRPFLESFSG